VNYDVTNFQSEVIERSKQMPVLVDFWAEWCGPCKILGPVLEKLAREADGTWQLAKVNTEVHTDIAQQYGIRGIPNVKLFVDGKMENEFVGALPEPMVKQWLEKHIPSAHRKDVERAERLVSEERLGEAQTLLTQVLHHEPDNHKARVLLARTHLFMDAAKSVELVQEIEEDSEQFDMAEAIRTFGSLFAKGTRPESLPDGEAKNAYLAAIDTMRAQDWRAALDAFIGIIRNDRYYDDDGARKACVAIFKILGEEHEVTQQYRREFSRALY